MRDDPDVFHQYAQKMDERCGNHEDMISSVSKKIDKLNQLFTGLVVSLLVAGVGFTPAMFIYDNSPLKLGNLKWKMKNLDS